MEQKLPTPGPFISIDSTVEIEAPIGEVFERWCRVEEFPSFMEGVREIRWLDEKKFSLKSENDGEFYHSLCELTLRIPERRMAWRTIDGPDCSGVACFQLAAAGRTEVTLKMRYNPETGWHNQKQVRERLQRNMERFKALVEAGKTIKAN
ncbi:cyclase/dehydrase [Chthoniobacter flavus Ellin428]|uniref:Cyclase/dehydrase n=1 Tax=Chthoniobacter flavus Ellin428 TaxID=497964 RepID=B4CVW1_9BACT|nr:SRPBCC family protein [Chthoniobacter flavus]EDY21553.1 cyclase/dehydrase [Chthoniobacter flavus Ellin428]TCO95498.1 polyketide cyclase/dehydrase/lipid transport protein [Chthoniobacter flavus]